MASIKDVARLAGVSVSTVSLAMNGSGPVSRTMKERVAAAARALGYTPNGVARSLRLGRSSLVGFVVADIANPFFASLAKIIQRDLLEFGFSLMICDSDEDPERELALLESLQSQRVAGLILAPTGRTVAYKSRLELVSSVPIVTVDRRIKQFERDFIGLDNAEAGRLLARYLIRLGHERIAFVGGPEGLSTAEERLEGFRTAVQEAGLATPPHYYKRGDFRAESGYAAARDLLLGSSPPTCIASANNLMLLGVQQAAEDIGFRCPADVSLVGIDEVLIRTALHPKLTIAAQPVDEIGRLSVAQLLARIESDDAGYPEPRSVLLPPTLIIGESCRDLRARLTRPPGRRPSGAPRR